MAPAPPAAAACLFGLDLALGSRLTDLAPYPSSQTLHQTVSSQTSLHSCLGATAHFCMGTVWQDCRDCLRHRCRGTRRHCRRVRGAQVFCGTMLGGEAIQ